MHRHMRELGKAVATPIADFGIDLVVAELLIEPLQLLRTEYFNQLILLVREPASVSLGQIWIEHEMLAHTLVNLDICNQPYDSLMCILRSVLPWHDRLPEHAGDPLPLNRGQLQEEFDITGRSMLLCRGPVRFTAVTNVVYESKSRRFSNFQTEFEKYLSRFASDGKHEPIPTDFTSELDSLLLLSVLLDEDSRVAGSQILERKVLEMQGRIPTMQWISEVFYTIFSEIAKHV